MIKRDLLTELFMQGVEPSDPADAVGSLNPTVDTLHLAGLDDDQRPKIVLDSGTYEIDTSADEPKLVRVAGREASND